MSSLCHMDLQNLLLGEVLFFFQAWWLDLPTNLLSGILMPTPPWPSTPVIRSDSFVDGFTPVEKKRHVVRKHTDKELAKLRRVAAESRALKQAHAKEKDNKLEKKQKTLKLNQALQGIWWWAGSASSTWKTQSYSHLHTWSNHATDHLLLGKSVSWSVSWSFSVYVGSVGVGVGVGVAVAL